LTYIGEYANIIGLYMTAILRIELLRRLYPIQLFGWIHYAKYWAFKKRYGWGVSQV